MPDLRGIGESTGDPTGDAFDLMAEDVYALTKALGVTNAYVVGHDLGEPVAYTLAKLHPGATRGVMIVEAPLEGMPTWHAAGSDPALWHIGFHQTPDLPEQLIAGRERVYVRHFFGVRRRRSKADQRGGRQPVCGSLQHAAQLQFGRTAVLRSPGS